MESSIRQMALDSGFVACGFARIAPLPEEMQRMRHYLEAGYHGEMHYLERHGEKRENPALLVAGARSVMSVLYYYYPHESDDPQAAHIARFAWDEDYHKEMKTRLNLWMDKIKTLFPQAQMRAFVDTAPLFEKAWAERCGLGWRGKNTLLIHPVYGSFCHIGLVLTDLELQADTPMENRCGSCRLCLQACPNAALVDAYRLNATRCIAYQTIERESPEPDIDLHAWTYGCDLCQEACPWNAPPRPLSDRKFIAQNRGRFKKNA